MNEIIAGNIIFSMLQGALSNANLISIFDGDLELSRYFDAPDNLIIQELLKHDRFEAIDWIGLQNAIGNAGKERLKEIQLDINGSCLNYTQAKKLIHEHIIPAWQKKQGRQVFLTALTQLDHGDMRDIASQAMIELSNITSGTRNIRIQTSNDAHDNFLKILRGQTGLVDDFSLMTGFPIFDNEYYGLQRGKKTIIAGAPGSGKTALISKMAGHILNNDGVVLRLIEMDSGTEFYRDAVRESGVTSASLWEHRKRLEVMKNNPDYAAELEEMIACEKHRIQSSEDFKKIESAAEKLRTLKTRYYPAHRMNAVKILSVMNSIKSEYGKLDLVVIDHIQLLNTVDRCESALQVRQVLWDFEYYIQPYFPDTAFVFLQHQNKDLERSNVRKIQGNTMIVPMLGDLAYGGGQDVDNVFFITRIRQYAALLGFTEEKVKELELAWKKSKEARERDDRILLDDRILDYWYGGHLWSLKARNGEGERAIPMRYYGANFDWKEHRSGQKI